MRIFVHSSFSYASSFFVLGGVIGITVFEHSFDHDANMRAQFGVAQF
jgi:hypothetical protein